MKDIYAQYWLHVRHIENVRLTFTSAYLLALTFGLQRLLQAQSFSFEVVLVTAFLLLLSFVGFSLTWRITVTSRWLFENIKRMTPMLAQGESFDIVARQDQLERAAERPEHAGLNRVVFRMSHGVSGFLIPLELLFPMFYVFGGCIAVAIFPYVLYGSMKEGSPRLTSNATTAASAATAGGEPGVVPLDPTEAGDDKASRPSSVNQDATLFVSESPLICQ